MNSSSSGISYSASSTSELSSGGSLVKMGEVKSAANAIIPALGSSGVPGFGEDVLAALPIALVVIDLLLPVVGGEKIELPSVNSRLFR